MADQFSPEVPAPPAPETDLAALSAEVAKHRENPEARSLTGHELVKKSIQTMAAPAAPAAPADPSNPLPGYAQAAPAETKREIEHLLSIAFREGIVKASAEAARSNPFVLDAFHDALAGRLYPELQKRGIVE